MYRNANVMLLRITSNEKEKPLLEAQAETHLGALIARALGTAVSGPAHCRSSCLPQSPYMTSCSFTHPFVEQS